MWTAVPYVGAVVVIWVVCWVYKWRNPRCMKGRLPPGSMGLPLLGETLSFVSPSTSLDVAPFIKARMKRYGSIFKTNLLGMPIIISTDPDFSYFIFQQEGRQFQLWYPGSFTKIFGSQNTSMLYGTIYKCIKNLTMSIFGSENIRKNLIPDMEQACQNGMQSWAALDSVELKHAIGTMIFELSAKKMISYDPSEFSGELSKYFIDFVDGVMSFPLNVPGTTFHKSLQSYKKAMTVLKDMMDKRRAVPPETRKGDLLDLLINETEKDGSCLTEKMALNALFVLLFASFETTSLSLTFLMKILIDHPEVVEELTEEHDAIVRNMEDKECGITWETYKSMTFTSQVIHEALRLANITPMIFRKSSTNVHVKGYTIPAGSMVMVYTPALHLDHLKYPDPLSFKPRRWEGQDTRVGTKHFMVFGGGSRLCVGAEFSRLLMSVFLHHLVTKYRWKTTRGGEFVRRPMLTFPNGFHVQLFQRKVDGDPSSS